MSLSYQHDDQDAMSIAKEHKLQQEIDRADFLHDEIRDRKVEEAFRKSTNSKHEPDHSN